MGRRGHAATDTSRQDAAFFSCTPQIRFASPGVAGAGWVRERCRRRGSLARGARAAVAVSVPSADAAGAQDHYMYLLSSHTPNPSSRCALALACVEAARRERAGFMQHAHMFQPADQENLECATHSPKGKRQAAPRPAQQPAPTQRLTRPPDPTKASRIP